MNNYRVRSLAGFFWTAIAVTFLIKLYLAYLVPITGDEAEYISWARTLYWGYYDHPPMIAWVLHPFTLMSLNPLCLRFLQVLASTLIAFFIWLVFKSEDKVKAYWVSLLYLVSPLSVMNIAILTDTPLLLFSFISIFLLYVAEKNRYAYSYYALSGLFLGAAYLSKYLMFPLALSIFLYFIIASHIPHRWRRFFVLILLAMPFFIQNIVWNYDYDWANFFFNLSTRNAHETITLKKPILYLLSILYLYSPFALFYYFRRMKQLPPLLRSRYAPLALAAFTPILFLFLLSLVKKVGLHWIFSAYPFFFMVTFAIWTVDEIRHCVWFMCCYTLVQLIIGIALLHLPLTFWQSQRIYPKVNWFLNYSQMTPKLQPYLDKGFILLTPSYSQSYLLTYKTSLNASVWGAGSVHGRQDDLTTDFKQYANKNLLIVDIHQKIDIKTEVEPYFNHYQVRTINFNTLPVRLILGYGFRYIPYRNTVLRQIFNNYYQLPRFLPRGGYYYKNKYDL